MELPKKIKDEIWDYCRVNNISNIDEFTLKLITQGFTAEKYGSTPSTKEKIVEKVVEVEKIVEKVIEKEVYITDDTSTKELTDKIVKLENDLIVMKESYEEEIKKLKTKNKGDLYGE